MLIKLLVKAFNIGYELKSQSTKRNRCFIMKIADSGYNSSCETLFVEWVLHQLK